MSDSSTQTKSPEPMRLGFFSGSTFFLLGGMIGYVTANYTATSIKGFTKKKTWEDTGENYIVFTNAGQLYAGVLSVGFGLAAIAFACYIIYKWNHHLAAHPELIDPPSSSTPQPLPVPLTPEEERRLQTVIAGGIGLLLGLSVSVATCYVINGFSKQKTPTNDNGCGDKYQALTSDGELYILGLTIACGLVASIFAWYRKPICAQVVKLFSNAYSPERESLIQSEINDSPSTTR